MCQLVGNWETLDEGSSFTSPVEIEICKLSERPEVDEEGWIRLLLDSECARTVFPMDADYGISSEPKRKQLRSPMQKRSQRQSHPELENKNWILFLN